MSNCSFIIIISACVLRQTSLSCHVLIPILHDVLGFKNFVIVRVIRDLDTIYDACCDYNPIAIKTLVSCTYIHKYSTCMVYLYNTCKVFEHVHGHMYITVSYMQWNLRHLLLANHNTITPYKKFPLFL